MHSSCQRCPRTARIVIFFSLTEAPSHRPHPTPPNTPKRTRNRPEREPNGPERTQNRPKRTRNGPKSSSLGWDGLGVCRGGGVEGAVREKENHYARISHGNLCPKDPAVLKILRVVNLLRVGVLLSPCDLLSRCTLCGHQFPGNCRHLPSPGRVCGVVNLGGVVKTLLRSNSLFLQSS